MDRRRFTLVMPAKLWDALEGEARRNRRAITQEVLIALENHLGVTHVVEDRPKYVYSSEGKRVKAER